MGLLTVFTSLAPKIWDFMRTALVIALHHCSCRCGLQGRAAVADAVQVLEDDAAMEVAMQPAATAEQPCCCSPKPPCQVIEAPTSAQQVFDMVKLNSRDRRSTVHGRVVGESRACRPHFMRFIQRILDNDPSLGECGSRVLRLKPTLDLDTTTFEVDMVIEALRYNYRVEALYIHNFESVRHPNGLTRAATQDAFASVSKLL
jgi:hypothetical protein